MMLAVALLAAGAITPPNSLPGRYVAANIPSSSIQLDAKTVCTTDGFVDPKLLAVQVMIQLKMFKDLAAAGASEALPKFDGRTCPATGADDGGDSYCTASIFVQRLLLNVYPGYRPSSELLKGL